MVELQTLTIRLIVDGAQFGSWSQVKGLDISLETVDYQPSRESLITFLDRYATRQIRTGFRLAYTGALDSRLTTWHQQARLSSMAAKKNCSILLLSYDMKPIATYHLTNAWPSKIEAGSVTMSCDNYRRIP